MDSSDEDAFAEALLAGADPNGLYVPRTTALPHQRREECSVLIYALASGDEGSTRRLIAAGATAVPAPGVTPPFIAWLDGRVPGHPTDLVGFGDFYQRWHALGPLLLAAGADVAAVGVRGRTPLMTAVETQAAPFTQWLLEAGAPVDQANPEGTTALHGLVRLIIGQAPKPSGASRYYLEVFNHHLDLLLAAGADPLLRNMHGESAEQMLADSPHRQGRAHRRVLRVVRERLAVVGQGLDQDMAAARQKSEHVNPATTTVRAGRPRL